jgi:hypothetical protein
MGEIRVEHGQREEALRQGRIAYDQARHDLHSQVLHAAMEGITYDRIADVAGLPAEHVFVIASGDQQRRADRGIVFGDEAAPLRVALVSPCDDDGGQDGAEVLAVGVLDPVSGSLAMIWRGPGSSVLTRLPPTTTHAPLTQWVEAIRNGPGRTSLIMLDPPMSEAQHDLVHEHGAIHDPTLAAAAMCHGMS